MIAWIAVVLGINNTCNVGNFTWLLLVKITSCIARAIYPNTTADRATNILINCRMQSSIVCSLFWYKVHYMQFLRFVLCVYDVWL